MSRIRLLFLVSIVFLLAGVLAPESYSPLIVFAQPLTPSAQAACDELVDVAVLTVGAACEGLGRNEACYGNRLIEVEFQPDAQAQFDISGDRADLLAISRLHTTALDEVSGNWGIAILKAQANLPDALPGQNVTFLLFGDAAVNNPSPDMRAVTVETRVAAGVTCEEVPPSALLIQSPGGQQVTLNLNGADVTLASTVYVTAPADGVMTLATLEGLAIVTAFDVVRVVQPGGQVTLPLGLEDGLQVIGAASPVTPFDWETIQHAPLELLDDPIDLPEPLAADATATQTPTITPTPCLPRADWFARYVVERGDTLSDIARRIGYSAAALQQANCLLDPNVIFAGQVLIVPVAVPTRVPPVTPTPTGTAFVPSPPILTANPNPIGYQMCSVVSWVVTGSVAVQFEGSPVSPTGSATVCPGETTTYTLNVEYPNGQQIPYPITVTVGDYCGDGICTGNETYQTCPAECG
jgi:LysM repeat protein